MEYKSPVIALKIVLVNKAVLQNQYTKTQNKNLNLIYNTDKQESNQILLQEKISVIIYNVRNSQNKALQQAFTMLVMKLYS